MYKLKRLRYLLGILKNRIKGNKYENKNYINSWLCRKNLS